MRKCVACLMMTGGILLSAESALSFDKEKAQEVLKEKGPAVVTLEIVMDFKSTFQGQQNEQEQRTEEVGFFVDEKGLVATSLSNVDPGSFYAKTMDTEDYSFTSTVKSVKVILADGKEIPASVVLRDPDLDLAFLRPLVTPTDKMPFVSLEDAPKATVFDDIFSLERTGRITRRTLLGKAGRVTGVVERPRMYYLPSDDLQSNKTGAPVFNDDGKLLGMLTIYAFPGGRNSRSETDESYAYIVTPAADVHDVARQAPEKAPKQTPTPAPAQEENAPQTEEKPTEQ